jgi:hypothetical protein
VKTALALVRIVSGGWERRDRHLAGALVQDEFQSAHVTAIDHAATRLRFSVAMLDSETASWTAPRHADLYAERMNGIKCAHMKLRGFNTLSICFG